ncbi:MAG: hypothetical protein ACOC8B_05540 [Gemmatimonadota bacterium]
MPETHPPTRIVRKDEDGKKKGRERDARAADVGLDSRETEERSRGRGFAEERESPATEHEGDRTAEGPAV